MLGREVQVAAHAAVRQQLCAAELAVLWLVSSCTTLVPQRAAAPQGPADSLPACCCHCCCIQLHIYQHMLTFIQNANSLVVTAQRLPMSLPELVEAAPSLTADGSIILGRREQGVPAGQAHRAQHHHAGQRGGRAGGPHRGHGCVGVCVVECKCAYKRGRHCSSAAGHNPCFNLV